MKIRINGIDADIQPDTEKTVGEVLSALESWLFGSGHRLSGLSIDGDAARVETMEACFTREIDSIGILDIHTRALTELLAESLIHVMQDITDYEEADYEQKTHFAVSWQESPGARLLAEQSSELYHWIVQAFSGSGSSTHVIRTIVEERLRELHDPIGETARTQPVVEEICKRLEEFPLDIQTGKDARAAETINVFSGIAEKVFRMYRVLRIEGCITDEVMVENTPIDTYISEFNTALQELLAAYEQRDTVLVGDITEYEMAPRLRNVHAAVLHTITQSKGV